MNKKITEDQVNSIFESIINMAQLDYSKKIIITDDDSQLNAIASGVNMLSEQMEHLLKKEKEKTDILNKTQEIAQIGTWTLDLVSNELFWSDEVYRIFGLQPQEFAPTYEAFLDVVHPDDREKVNAAYTNSVKQGKDGYEIEHRLLNRKTGELKYVLEKCRHERNASGNIICSIGYVQNITNWKNAEEKLNKSNELFFLLFENNPSTITVSRLSDGKLISVNPAFLSLFGFTSKEEVLGKTVLELNIFANTDDRAKILEQLKTGKRVKDREITMQNIAGKTKQVSASVLLMELEGEPCVFIIAEDITERKKTEESLRQNELRLNVAQQIAKIGSWELDIETGRITWSDELYNIFNCDPNTFTPVMDSFIILLHPNYREAMRNWIARGMTGIKQEPFNFQLADGSDKWISGYGEFVFNKNGKPVKAYGTSQDITKNIKAEESLHQNESRLNVAQQIAKIGSWELDIETGRITWSDEMYNIHNCDPETFTINTESLLNLIHPDDREALSNQLATIASGKKGYPLDFRLNTPDSSVKWIRGQGVAVFNDAGKPIRANGTAQDITESKKNEESLQKSIKEISDYKNALQNQNNAVSRSNAIIEFSTDGNILFANDNFLILFGYQLNEIKGKHHRILVDKKVVDTNKYKEFWNHLNEGNFHQGEFERIRKDGKTIWIQGSYNPIFDSEGKLIKVMKIVTDITERKQMEEILQKTIKEMQDYKTALDESSIVAITNVKGIIQYANNNFCKISGYSIDELIGQDHRIINSGYHSKEFLQDLWKTIAKGKIWRGDIKNKSKNGTFYWVDTSIIPFLNKQGKPTQYLAIRIDITKRKNAEEEISKKNIFLDAIIENIPSMIFVKDAKDFRFIRLNKAGENLLGYNREEMIGKNDFDFFPKKEAEIFISQDRGVFANRELLVSENVISTLNDQRLIRTQKMPVFDENGLPDYLLGISEDITEQKQSEIKLKIIAEKLNEAQEISNSGSWEWNFSSETGLWSENYYKLLKFNENEIKPTLENFLSRIHPDDKHIVEETLASISIEKKTVEIEVRAIMPNVSVRWLSYKIIPVLNEDELIGLKGVLVDITERKQIQEQLLKVNNELEAFSYSVSHDLRAPLRAIIGFTSILEEDYTSKLDDEAKRITDIIKTNTKKMGILIDDLLAFSRLRRQIVSKINIHTNALVKEVIDEMFIENNKNIEWVIASLPDSEGDNNLIHQVWVNLISNAVKYSGKKENPRIEIGNFKKEGQQVFFVKDNGAGFDEQFNNKLFKVFQRLHSVDDFEGTGIGLAIIEKIISKHGGSVWAEGEVNKGACFYFSLPMDKKP